MFEDKTMKILYICHKLGKTSSGTINRRVANELAKQGHEVKVISSIVYQKIDNSNCELFEIKSLINRSSIVFRLVKKAGRILQVSWFDYDWLWIRKCQKRIDELFKIWRPDFVYCRSTPFEPFFLGKYIKKKYRIKVLMHFNDPMPAISEFPNKQRFISAMSRQMKDLVSYADKLSYGTKEMWKMEEVLLGIDLSPKSFVSPDVVNETQLKFFEKDKHNSFLLVYFGSFNISRNPLPLFTVIEQLRAEGANCELKVYSTQGNEFKTYDGVRFVGKSQDKDRVLSEPDVLVDLTVENIRGGDVYVSSKLKDYLIYNRPILSISGEGCATRNMLKGLKTVLSVENEINPIKRAVLSMMSSNFSDNDFEEREELINLFDPTKIVKQVIYEMNTILNHVK